MEAGAGLAPKTPPFHLLQRGERLLFEGDLDGWRS